MKRHLIGLWLCAACYLWETSTFYADASFPIGNGRRINMVASHYALRVAGEEPTHGTLGIEIQQWDRQPGFPEGFWVIWNKWVRVPF